MKRRLLISAWRAAALGSAMAASPALAQTARSPRRVALLLVSARTSDRDSMQPLRDGLHAHGYIEGRDIAIDVRFAEGRAQDLGRLAAELAANRPEVFVATGPARTDAAFAATTVTPIVALGDLVTAGHADSLARPGGRVTGISFLPVPLNTKRLELLAELLPRGQRGAQPGRAIPASLLLRADEVIE